MYAKPPKSPMNEHIDRYLHQIHDLLIIILSDNEGVHMYNACHPSVTDKLQKIIQTSTMLISTIVQCEGNYEKIGKSRAIDRICYYYDQHLVYFRRSKMYNVTLVMRPNASGLLAEEIAEEVARGFGFLNGVLGKKE